jgi:hypothetical protein
VDGELRRYLEDCKALIPGGGDRAALVSASLRGLAAQGVRGESLGELSEADLREAKVAEEVIRAVLERVRIPYRRQLSYEATDAPLVPF